MPIIRTYACPDCGHFVEVVLAADEWNTPPPECDRCARDEMDQEFRPIGIVGSHRAKAVKLTEDILEHDYNVADFQLQGKDNGPPKIRYKDRPEIRDAVKSMEPEIAAAMRGEPRPPNRWGATAVNLGAAMAAGRRTRMEGPTGVDILHEGIKSGGIPDLIANSKRLSPRIW